MPLIEDMPLGEYLALPALSAHWCMTALRSCPAKAEYEAQAKTPDTAAMALGSAFHLLLLEPQRWHSDIVEIAFDDYRTKAAREAIALQAPIYADKAPGGFLIGELTAPFTPERYRQAIGEFIETGIDVLVIDSFSHVWEGTGGVLDMADAAASASGKPLQGLAKWLEPKKQYRKLLQLLMQSSIHIVFCSRAKQPTIERLDANGKAELIPGPWKPVQDKTLRYEMTIALPMIEDGHYDTRLRDELGAALFKCPSDLRAYFDGSPPTVALGAKIAEWVGGVKTVDSELERLLIEGQSADADAEKARLAQLALEAGEAARDLPASGMLLSWACQEFRVWGCG